MAITKLLQVRFPTDKNTIMNFVILTISGDIINDMFFGVKGYFSPKTLFPSQNPCPVTGYKVKVYVYLNLVFNKGLCLTKIWAVVRELFEGHSKRNGPFYRAVCREVQERGSPEGATRLVFLYPLFETGHISFKSSVFYAVRFFVSVNRVPYLIKIKHIISTSNKIIPSLFRSHRPNYQA
jgi:hypothetical protein